MRPDGWLVHSAGPRTSVGGAQVLATVEVAGTRAERRRGLLGREHIDGVLVLGVRSVHTVGMRSSIDVAHLDGDGTVLRVTTMRPNRVGRPVRGARRVVEAPAGAFARWGVLLGDRLEVRT